MEQESPPGYVMIMAHNYGDLRDKDRWARMPEELRQQLREYGDNLRAKKRPPHPTHPVCLWLDRENNRCRHYEWRPQICRDFEVGSRDCHSWRKEYPPSQTAGAK